VRYKATLSSELANIKFHFLNYMRPKKNKDFGSTMVVNEFLF